MQGEIALFLRLFPSRHRADAVRIVNPKCWICLKPASKWLFGDVCETHFDPAKVKEVIHAS